MYIIIEQNQVLRCSNFMKNSTHTMSYKLWKRGLFGPGNAKLPLPPMLMFDRITEINDKNGTFKKRLIKS